MFRRILLAVDLADEAETPKGLPEALELVAAGGGDIRLVNVQPLLPATFMEYVPADFDAEQERRPSGFRSRRRAAASTTNCCARHRTGARTSSSSVRIAR